MNKSLRIAIAIVAAIIGWALGSYLVRAITLERQVSDLSNTSINTEDYRKNFMEGCVEVDFSGSGFNQTQYCACMYDEMVTDRGIEWFIKAVLNNEEPQYKIEIENYATLCLSNQGLI